MISPETFATAILTAATILLIWGVFAFVRFFLSIVITIVGVAVVGGALLIGAVAAENPEAASGIVKGLKDAWNQPRPTGS